MNYPLGDKFSLSAFHDELLGAGALPMDVLEQRMNEWIARAAAGCQKEMAD